MQSSPQLLKTQKIVITGPSASGKTTLARQLRAALGMEVIHLDQYYWQSGWVRTPAAEWRGFLANLVRRDRWLMEGNYSGTLDIQFAAADTIIFLDLPRRLCLWRAMQRRLAYLGRARSDLAPSCPDHLTRRFVHSIWRYPAVKRPLVLQKIAQYAKGKQIITLRQHGEVSQFLVEMERRAVAMSVGRPQPNGTSLYALRVNI